MGSQRLKYFTSIELPEDQSIQDTFKSMEDILQQEHGSDGKHRIASEAQSGFISAQDMQKINRMFEWFQKNVVGK